MVGLALLASALAMFVGAVLVWSRTIAVGEGARTLVTGALIAAAVVDVFVGAKFLQSAD